MAKRMYIGQGGLARRVKKIYVGAGGYAARVKKAYVGIGGTARPFFGGGTPAYYGRAADLAAERFNMTGVTIGGRAVFAGGCKSVSSAADTASNDIDLYDGSLVHTTSTLPAARHRMAGCGMGDWALLAGGKTAADSKTTCASTVYKVDISLTKTAAGTGLTTAVYSAAAAAAGQYALVSGGRTGTSSSAVRAEVYAYDRSLTRTQPASLSLRRGRLSGCALGERAIFAGGDAEAAGVTLDGYAVFGGGYYGTTAGAWQCDIYDESMTRTAPADDMGRVGISSGEYTVAGAKAGDYAVFAGDCYAWARAFIQA